jgi:hypothetical protein
MVEAGSGIMAKEIGDFCTKICYFIRKNMAENGPLEFHTVLSMMISYGNMGCGVFKQGVQN